MQTEGQLSAPLPGLAGALGLALLSLGLVCVVAYGVLRFLARRGVGRRAAGPIRVLARCTLEPRRCLYLIDVDGRRLLVGVGDGPMTTLADLGGDSSDGAPAPRAVPPDLAGVGAEAGGTRAGLADSQAMVASTEPSPPFSAVLQSISQSVSQGVLQKVRAPRRPGPGQP